MGKFFGNNSIRSDFVLLLHMSIIAFVFIGWLLLVLILAASGERIFSPASGFFFNFFMLLIFPLIIAAFISVISVALSNILRQEWWIAVIGCILLLGTPLTGLMITWIGKQIGRLFYLATPYDLQKTQLVLEMTVKPRKGIIYDDLLKPINGLPSNNPAIKENIEKKSKLQMAELKVDKEKTEKKKQKQSELPRYFTLWQSSIASLFGGILAGVLLISFNYKNLKEKTNFIIGLIISIVGQFLLIIVIVGIMDSSSQNIILLPIILAIPISVYFWQRELQNEEIVSAISSNQAIKGSWWEVAAFIFIAWLFYAVFNYPATEIIWALDIPFR